MPASSRLAGMSTDRILSDIAAMRASQAPGEDFVALLAEESPIYAGRRADEVERLRSSILAGFEAAGLPAIAFPFIYEELESGANPQTIAAASRALRGATEVPSRAVELLIRAIDRLAVADDIVEFEAHESTTVLTELFRTLTALGPRAASARHALTLIAKQHGETLSEAVRVEMRRALTSMAQEESHAADCCGHAATEDDCCITSAGQPAELALEDLGLQDQDGVRSTFGKLFIGRPSVLTFFYTRCMVPEKCSLTVTKLGELQREIANLKLGEQVNVAAITYDPAFDLPPRLLAYGSDRGMTFDDRNRLLRPLRGIEPLRSFFGLGVGFGAVTVNRHRLELFILDKKGNTVATFARTQWSVADVLAALRRCIC